MEFTNDENSSYMEYNCEDINELIIHYVRSRPQLWDFKNKQYRDNVIKKKLWCEVAQELNMTVDNTWDTNTRQPEQTEFCSPHNFRSLFHPNSALSRPNSALSRPNSALPRSNSASPRSNCTLPSPVRAPSRTPSISPGPSSASYLRDSATPPLRATSRTVDNQPQQNQIQPAKRTKRQLSDTHINAVDEAILNLVQKRSSIDTMNSDDLFYLSISRDSQHLNVNAKLRLKTLVLQALSQVVAEEQNKI
ncbi:hypothetical protein ALC57_03117 [Trachymyrmex cornetzi]|uniref:MADF domain-containing protein n=1 Tax=Trachymyrmex cornetzi TaxID=471704 RepID=A0A151JN01_9HYME|nr:hypothetical protein ALC57_03117 [Trachymyrmex cornetzi]